MLNLRFLLVAGLILVAFILLAGTALAGPPGPGNAGNSGLQKPGWGYGDPNHQHTGPPGQSVHP